MSHSRQIFVLMFIASAVLCVDAQAAHVPAESAGLTHTDHGEHAPSEITGRATRFSRPVSVITPERVNIRPVPAQPFFFRLPPPAAD